MIVFRSIIFSIRRSTYLNNIQSKIIRRLRLRQQNRNYNDLQSIKKEE